MLDDRPIARPRATRATRCFLSSRVGLLSIRLSERVRRGTCGWSHSAFVSRCSWTEARLDLIWVRHLLPDNREASAWGRVGSRYSTIGGKFDGGSENAGCRDGACVHRGGLVWRTGECQTASPLPSSSSTSAGRSRTPRPVMVQSAPVREIRRPNTSYASDWSAGSAPSSSRPRGRWPTRERRSRRPLTVRCEGCHPACPHGSSVAPTRAGVRHHGIGRKLLTASPSRETPTDALP
jgi:hypothetical protein